MVGDIYSRDSPRAWSTDGAFDRHLMPSMDAEEEEMPPYFLQGPGAQGSEMTVLESPCASSVEQKKKGFILLFCFLGGG